ncbi:hypothetical protein B0T25DRAFT_594658, partial [Lasiosphaeria hispida]
MTFQSLQEKVAFFEILDTLGYDSSDGEYQADRDEQTHRNKCRAFFGSQKKTPRATGGPRRTFSAPTTGAVTPPTIIVEATPDAWNLGLNKLPHAVSAGGSFVEETPIAGSTRTAHPLLQQSTTFPTCITALLGLDQDQSPSMNSSMRKRKRQSSATKPVPESAQIFKSLSFYYIPNNDVNPVRKQRIQKAQAYGARWVRELSVASHVVVDSRLVYQDIEKILPSQSSPIVVNEEYPIDCIFWGTLLPAARKRYMVSGAPDLTNTAITGDTDSSLQPQSPSHSLPLKDPLARREHASQNQTPPREDADSDSGDVELIQQPLSSSPQLVRAASPRPHVGDSASGSSDSLRPQSDFKDELADYIQLMRQYKDLPLDAEEDDFNSARNIQDAISDSDTDSGLGGQRKHKRQSSNPTTDSNTRSKGKSINIEDGFACHRGGTRDKQSEDGSANPNTRTTEVLQSMCDYYTRIGDHWRTTAYRKAITTLRRQSTKITTEEEAYRLPNIGPRLAAKIEEIVSTNSLRRLAYAQDEPRDQALATFLKIYDVGAARANRWISQGLRTLDDVRARADELNLTKNQRIGLDRYDDLNTRIPRAEVAALGAYVMREAARIDSAIELVIGGSFRRGAESSGDVDLIVTKKGTTSAADLIPFLEELLRVLSEKGFLVATLAALHSQRHGKDGPGSKWHGCCVSKTQEGENLPTKGGKGRNTGSRNGGEKKTSEPVWRRMDILLVPETEYGAALIYFTGNDIFNRSMRLLASKKGMRLNQRGLYKDVMRGKGRVKVTEGELVEGRDEKRIFEILGVKWREPWERWC